MKRFLFVLIVVFATGAYADAPMTPYSHEVVTFDNTSGGVGLSATTITVAGRQMQFCSGVLETAPIRFYYDGTAPTSSDGQPLSVGQALTLTGFTSISRFRGIRQSSTSGVIRFTCSR